MLTLDWNNILQFLTRSFKNEKSQCKCSLETLVVSSVPSLNLGILNLFPNNAYSNGFTKKIIQHASITVLGTKSKHTEHIAGTNSERFCMLAASVRCMVHTYR